MPPARPTLSEHASKRLLAGYGVPLAREELVDSAAAAARAAAEIGFPVAVKLCGEGLAHKTERDLVRLQLADEGSVRSAAEELLSRAVPEDGDVGLLVAEMVLSFLVLSAVALMATYSLDRYLQPLGFEYEGVWRVYAEPEEGAEPSPGKLASDAGAHVRLRCAVGSGSTLALVGLGSHHRCLVRGDDRRGRILLLRLRGLGGFADGLGHGRGQNVLALDPLANRSVPWL